MRLRHTLFRSLARPLAALAFAPVLVIVPAPALAQTDGYPNKTVTLVVPFAKSNQVRILAVSTMKRDAALPDVPTLNESGLPGFDVLGWLGVMAPAGLSPAVRNKINDDLKAVLATEAVQQNMAKIGMQTVGGSPDDFGKYIASEYTRWGNVIKTGGIKAD